MNHIARFIDFVFSIVAGHVCEYTQAMDIGRIFSRGKPTEVKFYFTNSKLREKHFSTKKLTGKYQISKFRVQGLPTPSLRRP